LKQSSTKHKLKNPILFWMIAIFIFLNLADIATAFFILPGEANPLFLLTKSFNPVIIVKLGLIILLIAVYRRNETISEFTHYMYILTLVMSFGILGMGIYANIQGMMEPELVALQANVPAGEKIAAYGKAVGLFYMIPTIFSLIAFKLHQKSRDWKNAEPEKTKF